MNSAQGQHRRDLESKLRYHPTLSSPNEKDAWEEHAGRRSETMSKLPQYVVTVLLLLGLVAVGIVSATAHHQALQAAPLSLSPEESRFRELLNSVDPAALHDVLHEKIKDKYQHGVFQEDRTAMEAIHRQNAEVAENLIELAKRQAGSSGNGTVVTTTDSVTVSIVSDTSTPSSTAAAASAESTTSPAPSSTGLSVEQSASALPSSQPAASAVGSAITSAEASSSATGGVSTSLGGSTTARPSSTGSTHTPTSTGATSPSNSSSSTSSSSLSSSLLRFSSSDTTTASTAQSLSKSQDGSKTTASSSQTTIYTTTIANGVLSTVTSVKIIPAGQADQTAGSGSATTTPGNPSLQTGVGGRFTVGFSAVLGGAVMAFMGAL